MSFEDRLKVGKKAESIVVDFLEYLGLKVFRYGWEYSMPELTRYDLIGEASDYIRHMPDLVIFDASGKTYFVEVKYRSDDILKDKDLFNYPSCYVFLLTKKGILGQNVKELYNGKSFVEINQIPAFKNIPTEAIRKYDKVIRRKLGDEWFVGQLFDGLFGKAPPEKNAGFQKSGIIVQRKDEENTFNTCLYCGKLKDRKYDQCKDCHWKMYNGTYLERRFG